MADDLKTVQEIYDQLWSEGRTALERGQPDIDPFLSDRKNDSRRGITLTFSPSPLVRSNVEEFLRQAAEAAPEQHFYQSNELHTTILAVVPGSAAWQSHLPELPVLRAVILEVLRKQSTFSVTFRGVTVSPSAVMIQGFPTDNTLMQLRDNLRAAFKQKHVAPNVDQRYKIAAAHITAMRFSTPRTDWSRLLAVLAANRTTNFGEMRVQTAELHLSDWYASADTLQILDEYPLR